MILNILQVEDLTVRIPYVMKLSEIPCSPCCLPCAVQVNEMVNREAICKQDSQPGTKSEVSQQLHGLTLVSIFSSMPC